MSKNKYVRIIHGVEVDVYDILVAFGVRCPAVAHAIKKLLMPGQRGFKTYEQDLTEAVFSIERAKTLPSPSKILSDRGNLPDGDVTFDFRRRPIIPGVEV